MSDWHYVAVIFDSHPVYGGRTERLCSSRAEAESYLETEVALAEEAGIRCRGWIEREGVRV